MSEDGEVAFTLADTQRPADVALIAGKTARLAQLNEDALGDKELAKVEEIWLNQATTVWLFKVGLLTHRVLIKTKSTHLY